MKAIFVLQRLTAKSRWSIRTTHPTEEAICSSDSAKMKLGLPKSAKQYTNNSTVKATTGTPYHTIEPTGSHTWGKEYPKSTNTTHKLINTTFHLLEWLKNQLKIREN